MAVLVKAERCEDNSPRGEIRRAGGAWRGGVSVV